MTDAILQAFSIIGNGNGVPLQGKEVSKQIRNDALAWVHLDANHPDTKTWIQNEVSYLDPIIIEALLSEGTRPRLTEIGDGCLLILRGVNLNEGADPEDMVSVRLWVDQERIISLQRRPVRAILDLAGKLTSGQGPHDAGSFVAAVIARLFGRFEPVLSDIDERTDDIEEEVLVSASPELRQQITQVRKRAIMFRRYMAPQRDAISLLRNSEMTWVSETDSRRLQEQFHNVTRYVEDLDAIRERAQIVKDEMANMIADRLNKNMYVLSVIAAIFLPLGFLTGLMGINIGGMPGVENGSAFWVFSLMLLLVVVAQVWLFKRMKWF